MKLITGLITSLTILLLCNGCLNRLFYYPDRHVYGSPAKYGLRYEDCYFASADGTKLHGWFIPARGEPIGTIIHFHGNAQNITSHFEFISWLPEERFNVFTFDYRGYGRSQGNPDRRGVYQDSKAAIEYVRSRNDIDPNKLLVFGQSLGGANAISVIGSNRLKCIKAVAIESTFCSYRDIVRDKIDEIPVVCLLKGVLSFLLTDDEYSPIDVVDRISPAPILFVHGTADRVIPEKHSKELFNRAKDPKHLWIVKGADHLEPFTHFGETYRPQLVNFFKNALDLH